MSTPSLEANTNEHSAVGQPEEAPPQPANESVQSNGRGKRYPTVRPLPKVEYKFGWLDYAISDLLHYTPEISRLVQETSLPKGASFLLGRGAGFTVRMAISNPKAIWKVALAIAAIDIPEEYSVTFVPLKRKKLVYRGAGFRSIQVGSEVFDSSRVKVAI